MTPVRGWWRVQRLLGAISASGGFRSDPRPPRPSFDDWNDLDSDVLVVCHPDWRGVRTAAYAHRDPVIEVADAAQWADRLAPQIAGAGIRTAVLHGFPPGAGSLAEALRGRGVETRVVLHSSMAQHGAEAGESEVVDEVIRLADHGVVAAVGFVKAGLAEAFRAIGVPAAWVPNRAPELPDIRPIPLGTGRPHVGVFGEPFWRKNIATQLGAVALMDGATAHVLRRPDIGYTERFHMMEHGVLPWEAFLQVQASVDLNLYVTLSECYPISPIESYLSGVPCLISRTSTIFESDATLWELTSVDKADDPTAIARAAELLLASAPEAVRRAQDWIRRYDLIAEQRWHVFTGRS